MFPQKPPRMSSLSSRGAVRVPLTPQAFLGGSFMSHRLQKWLLSPSFIVSLPIRLPDSTVTMYFCNSSFFILFFYFFLHAPHSSLCPLPHLCSPHRAASLKSDMTWVWSSSARHYWTLYYSQCKKSTYFENSLCCTPNINITYIITVIQYKYISVSILSDIKSTIGQWVTLYPVYSSAVLIAVVNVHFCST